VAATVECVRDADGVAVVRASGALFGPDLLDALEARLGECLADEQTVGIVLQSGDAAFLGDLDLAWLPEAQRRPREVLAAFVERAAALAARIDAAAKPIAAAIAHDAHGPALELALACHHRVGAQGAGYTVGFTALRLGLAPMLGTAPRLSARIGAEKSRKLLADATALTPAAARKAGLLDELVPAEACLESATRWVALAAARRAQRPAEAAIAAMAASVSRDSL